MGEGRQRSAGQIDARLDEVAAHGLPYCVQARPQCHEAAAEVAKRREMVAAPEIPLMAAVGPVSVTQPRELAIRCLDVGESRLHAELAGAAWSWLQSTEPASRLYERVGFATLEQCVVLARRLTRVRGRWQAGQLHCATSTPE